MRQLFSFRRILLITLFIFLIVYITVSHSLLVAVSVDIFFCIRVIVKVNRLHFRLTIIIIFISKIFCVNVINQR